MSHVIKFCDKTIENVSEGVEKTKRELNQRLNDNDREEIISEKTSLQNNDELNKKHLKRTSRLIIVIRK